MVQETILLAVVYRKIIIRRRRYLLVLSLWYPHSLCETPLSFLRVNARGRWKLRLSFSMIKVKSFSAQRLSFCMEVPSFVILPYFGRLYCIYYKRPKRPNRSRFGAAYYPPTVIATVVSEHMRALCEGGRVESESGRGIYGWIMLGGANQVRGKWCILRRSIDWWDQ